VVLGGVGTLVVIAIWAWRFPELRQADQITGVQATTEGVGAGDL